MITSRIAKGAAMSVLAGMLAVGCSSNNKGGHVSRINVDDIVQSTDSPSKKASRLANAAEQLLSAQGFAYAADVADLALKQDPSNVKAKFVKAVTAPLLAQKGILARVAPLMERDAELKEGYDKMVADIEDKVPSSTLKTFLFDGSPDIATEADVQAQNDAEAKGWEQLRLFAKENKGTDLTIMTTDVLYSSMVRRLERACTITLDGSYNYEASCPSQEHMLEVTLTRADYEAIQNLAAGMEIYLGLFNSYDLTGSIQVAQNSRAKTPAPSVNEVIAELTKNPNFGTLRDGNGFKMIKEMGPDAVAGARWVVSHQDQLCSFGKPHPRNRVGFLFDNGLCVEQKSKADTVRGLNQVDQALNGATLPLVVHNPYGSPEYKTTVKPSAVINNPIRNVRSLLPLKQNKCGAIVGVGDATLAGVFPKGDFNHVLEVQETCY